MEPVEDVLRVGITSYRDIKARMLAIADRRHRPSPDEPKIWFTSQAGLDELLSPANREMLGALLMERPTTIMELARMTGRRNSEVLRELRRLEHYRMVRLARNEGRSGRTSIRPEAVVRRIEVVDYRGKFLHLEQASTESVAARRSS